MNPQRDVIPRDLEETLVLNIVKKRRPKKKYTYTPIHTRTTKRRLVARVNNLSTYLIKRLKPDL